MDDNNNSLFNSSVFVHSRAQLKWGHHQLVEHVHGNEIFVLRLFYPQQYIEIHVEAGNHIILLHCIALQGIMVLVKVFLAISL